MSIKVAKAAIEEIRALGLGADALAHVLERVGSAPSRPDDDIIVVDVAADGHDLVAVAQEHLDEASGEPERILIAVKDVAPAAKAAWNGNGTASATFAGVLADAATQVASKMQSQQRPRRR